MRANCPRNSSDDVPFNGLVHKELALCQSDGYGLFVRRKAHGVETRKHSRRVFEIPAFRRGFFCLCSLASNQPLLTATPSMKGITHHLGQNQPAPKEQMIAAQITGFATASSLKIMIETRSPTNHQ